MSSSHDKTGIIVASASGAVVVALCVVFVLLKGRLPFTFSRTPTPCVRDIEMDLASTFGEYEKYGELYIAPDKQPTVAAFDIMTRMLIVAGLPQKTRLPDSTSSLNNDILNKVAELPLFYLTRPDRNSLNTLDSGRVSVVAGAEAQGLSHGITQDRRITEKKRPATRQFKVYPVVSKDQAEVLEDGMRISGEVGEEGTMSDPLNSSFGSGRSMAELYR